MKRSIAFVFALIVAGIAFAAKLPEQIRSEPKEYPAHIEKAVESLNRGKLLDDAYFVKSLKAELKNKKHSEEEKVYYFYLMLRQIRWGFCGVVWMRPDGHYAEEMLFQCQTLASYRKELQKLKLDSASFYKLCHNNAEDKPILASYALLLATMLEPDDSKVFFSLVGELSAVLDKADFPLRSMLIHNTSSSLIMTTHVGRLSLLWEILEDHAVLEEEKEDLVIALAMSGHELSVQCVFQTLIHTTDSADDLLAHTCMYLIQNMVSEESFKSMLETYKEHAEYDFQTRLVDSVVARGYETPYLGESWIGQPGLFAKFWDFDGVEYTMYDDGLLISSGSFTELIPN